MKQLHPVVTVIDVGNEKDPSFSPTPTAGWICSW